MALETVLDMEGVTFEDKDTHVGGISYDFKKAFDSIDRGMMFSILRHYGIPEKIVNAIRVLYDNSTSRVYVGYIKNHNRCIAFSISIYYRHRLRDKNVSRAI